jgi:hypothetical protein
MSMTGGKPPELVIDGSEFRFVGFTLKSLIELNSMGSKVSIVGSTFEKVASCGSIISNSQPYYRTETECIHGFTNTAL